MVAQHGICAVNKSTWWRQWWLERRLQHGFLHLLGIERSIPDSQLRSWQHILGNTRKRKTLEDQRTDLLTEVNELHGNAGFRWRKIPGRC